MITKFGSFIIEGRNKIGNQVASRNRGGTYLRERVVPFDTPSVYREICRLRTTFLSRLWATLSESDRILWNETADQIPVKNIFAEVRKLSGFAFFMKVNSNLNVIGLPPLFSPPQVPIFERCFVTRADVLSATSQFYIYFEPRIPLSLTIEIWATPQLSAGISFVKSEYRFVSTINFVVDSPFDFYPYWFGRFGEALIPGKKIFVKFVPIDVNTGFAGQHSVISTIIQP